jgi:catalase
MRKLSYYMLAGIALSAFPPIADNPAYAGSTESPIGTEIPTQDPRNVSDPEKLTERTPGHLVKDLHAVFGEHHARAVHAKGTILQGFFMPSLQARRASSSELFKASTPVIVRFSNFTGLPSIPDTEPHGQPRGFAVKFLLRDGSNYDVVSHSFNGFPSPTAADFGDLLQAIAASGETASKPTALDAYLGSHPVAKQFLTTQTPPPESWATSAYYGVNAFEFTDKKNKAIYVRYRFVPAAGEHDLDAATLARQSDNYLSEEIERRVERAPIAFTWYAQIAEPGDAIADPSVPWPETRRLIELGVVTLDRMGPNTPLADKSLSFLPGTTLPGIGVADPMLTIRNAAYPTSFAERQ